MTRKMNRRKFLAASGIGAAGLLSGCGTLNSLQLGGSETSDLVVKLTVNTLGVGLGIGAARMAPEFDLVLRNVYSMAADGTLDTETINKLIGSLRLDPVGMLLVNRIVKVAELMGANVLGGNLTDISPIDPELLAEVASGYVEGYDLEKSAQGSSRKMV